MEKFITLLFLTIVLTTQAQTSNEVDSLSFCGKKYKVPEGCKAELEYQFYCNNYSIQWLYMSNDMFITMPDQFIEQLASKMKKFKKEPINCYLLDKEAKGYRISFETVNGSGYTIVAYGIANEQPVLVQLSIDKEALSNNDLPEFARQFLKLTK